MLRRGEKVESEGWILDRVVDILDDAEPLYLIMPLLGLL